LSIDTGNDERGRVEMEKWYNSSKKIREDFEEFHVEA
jgi:hypothetical protein